MEGEERDKLAYEAAVYREQLNLIQRELDRITLATLDLNNAAKTTESISNGEGMVPIGGGAFVKATISAEKVIIPIGGGYLAEMETKEATVELKKRIDATEKAIERLNTEFTNLVGKFQEANTKLKDLQNRAALNSRVNDNIREDYL
ncbi:MAG: prefoldin subunit alpha [Candidatus Micrarchaeia archaeon]|jgi:prefoldin alpha subunit